MRPLRAPFTEWLRACNERFARYSGSQFSPHELPGGPPCADQAAIREVTKLCKVKDCRKRVVKPRQKYCVVCAKARKRAANCDHIWRKRHHDVGKLDNSPIRAEGLTKTETQARYDDPKAPFSPPSFPTDEEPRQPSEPRETQ